MSRVTPADIEHLARLAALEIETADLTDLTAQLDRILAYVSQLDRLPAGVPEAAGTPYAPGPPPPLRADRVRRTRPTSIGRMASAVQDGLVVTPPLGRPEDA